jgi:CBS domain-containing protein
MKVEDFKFIPPFDLLSDAQLAELMRHTDIIYLKPEQILTIADQDPKGRFLLMPFKGRGQWQTDEGFTEIIHTQECAGATVLLTGGSGRFAALEEVLAYQIKGDCFLQLCAEQVGFRQYWTASFQQKRQALKAQSDANRLSDFMMTQTQEVWLCPVLWLPPDMPLVVAAKQIRQSNCSAALVQMSDQTEAIVTRNDLLDAFADFQADDYPLVGQIASLNPIAIQANDYLFNALLVMTEHNVSHVLVKKGVETIGILQQKTLLAALANQSILVAQQIERAQNLRELQRASESLLLVIRSLHTKGVKPRLISELVSSLNRQIYRKVARLTQPDSVGFPYALLILGSEGRQEQILRTDQDNALIWQDEGQAQVMQQWAQAIHSALISLGFPDCPGNIMVTNPLWCQSLSALVYTVRQWIYHPSNESMMYLSILLDADVAAGDAQLAESLKQQLHRLLIENRAFLAHFAKSALQFDTPVGLFSHFVTEKIKGRRLLDIKKGGIFPIVHGVRVLACEMGIRAKTTHQRLEELGKTKVMDALFAQDLSEALDFMQQLRLAAQLQALDKEWEIDNHIEPDTLNHLQRDMLKDAFKLVDQFKSLLSHHYKLQLIS